MHEIRPRRASVQVPNTCGELVQGVVDGTPFLVSCPIARFATVDATLRNDGRVCGPADRPRAVAAARATLCYLERTDTGVEIGVDNPLPVGRGFGTSTADVVGSIAATARAAGEQLSPEEIARLAVATEPSDGTMFPGLAVFDHRTGSRCELLGPAPDLAVVVLDFGGAVETGPYNARLDVAAWAERTHEHRRALALLRHGLHRGDLAAIGKAATLSAIAHQPLLPKPGLNAALGLANRTGAFGVCAAHSGTALGILLPPGAPAPAVAREACRTIPGLVDAWAMRLVGGGCRIITQEVRV